MEKYSGWLFTLFPFLVRKLMERAHWSPQNYLYVLTVNIEWLMVALWLYSLGYYIGNRSCKKDENEFQIFKMQCLDEIKSCYSRFENEYAPLKAKMEVLKFELEKEQWRVRSLRTELEEERVKRKRTPEQANKEAIHSVGGN
jgi:hypothetical protein